MFKRIRREIYLLPRGEQRALLLLSLLLIFSLLFRMAVQILPEREPDGLEEFEQEARMIMAKLARTDSIQRRKSDSMYSSAAANNSFRQSYRKTQRESPFPVDLNRADSVQLLPLPGVGPVFARRIINYRTLLGGYVCIDQLREVYGMKEGTVQLIADKVFIDSTAIQMMDPDSASFRELLRHPYLEYEDVISLVRFRDFKGNIQSKKELEDNLILADSVLQKVLPYLDLE